MAYFQETQRQSNGKSGSLHVKLAVADRLLALVSSANLTDYAFNMNMEMGILIRGGKIPAQIHDHFYKLIEAGEFQRIET